MKRLRWQLVHVWRSIGVPGWAGVAIASACAGVWWGASMPLRDETRRLDAASTALERRAQQRPVVMAAVASSEQQLQMFANRFPSEKGIAPALVRLHALARQRGVVIEQAEFRYASEASEPLARYTIVLPVKADYRAMRRFTGDLLREMPGLALEEVNLRRSDAKSPVLESQLRLVLFVAKAV